MLIVMVISIIFFIFIRVESPILRVVYRVALVPVIAGVSYEFIRLAGNTDNLIIRILSLPGMWLQSLTTKEPDDDMIEVAIAAVEAVFDWRAYQGRTEEDFIEIVTDVPGEEPAQAEEQPGTGREEEAVQEEEPEQKEEPAENREPGRSEESQQSAESEAGEVPGPKEEQGKEEQGKEAEHKEEAGEFQDIEDILEAEQ